MVAIARGCAIYSWRYFAGLVSLLARGWFDEGKDWIGDFKRSAVHRSCGHKKIRRVISAMHTEVVLAASYAMFLTTVALGLELLARHSHTRSERYRNSGFIYFQDRDAWECPAGQQLLRQETQHGRRIIHYRAPAEACNRCALKNNCTDSNEGRVLKSHLDSWIESELRRFHRGISVVLLLLAAIILSAEAMRHSEGYGLLVVASLLLPISLVETKLIVSFLSRKTNT